MTTCQHDPTYRSDNEANGGAGCPLCNCKRIVIVQHDGGSQEVAPEFAPLRWNPDTHEMETLKPGWLSALAVTNERARVLADEQRAKFLDWLNGERGAGCAGNDAETCEAGGLG